MGAVQHLDVPVVGVGGGFDRLSPHGSGLSPNGISEVQHIPRAQMPPCVSTKLPQREGAAAAQVQRHIEPPGHGQRQPHTGIAAAHGKQATGRHLDGLPHRHRLAVEREPGRRTGHSHHRGCVEAQRGPGQGDFQRRCIGRIAHQRVGSAVGLHVHGAAGWHTHGPVALAAWPVLHAGLHAGLQHVDGGRLVRKGGEKTCDLFARAEHRVAHHLAQVAQVGLDACEARGVERVFHLLQRLVARVGGDDQFGQHGVVPGGHLGAALHPAVHARLARRIGGKHHLGEQAGTRLEVFGRVFGVQPHLNGRALWHRLQRVQRRQVAGRKLQHPGHQIHPAHLLGHAVLHLQARVHFQKIERAGGGVVNELHRAGRTVVHRLREPHGGGVQLAALRLAQARRRGFFNHFLVAPLHRAVALAQRNHATRAVAKHLHLDVPRLLHVFFDEQARVLEVGLRHAPDRFKRIGQLGRAPHQPHADAAAASRALEHHWKTHALRLALRMREVGQQARARQQRHAALLGQIARGVLEAKGAHLLGRRANEGDARRLTRFGKRRVLRQKTVAGVDGLRAAVLGDLQDAVGAQVTLGRRRGAEQVGLVGLAHVAGLRIGFGIHGHALHTQRFERADDAAGNGAAVGNQDFGEHKNSGAGRPAKAVKSVRSSCCLFDEAERAQGGTHCSFHTSS